MGKLADWMLGREPERELTADDAASKGTVALTPSGSTSSGAGPGDPSRVAYAAPLTRDEALSVPAVVRGRNLICGAIGAMPFLAYRRMGDIVEEVTPPRWTEQPDPAYTRGWTLGATVADLLFDGRAYWRVRARDAARWPVAFEYLDRRRVGYQRADAGVAMLPSAMGGGWSLTVDGRAVADDDVVRFDGIADGGILTWGARELRTAIALSDAARRFAGTEIPAGVIQDTGSMLASPEEVDAFLADWESARRGRTTAYLGQGLAYAGDATMDPVRLQLIEARQQSAVEVSRLMGIPVSYEAAPSGDSMTYSTVEGQRRDLVDITLAPWLTAIEQRLSLGDVTPRGTQLRMDVEAFQRGTQLDRWRSWEIAVRIGALTPADVAKRESYTPAATVPEMPTPEPAQLVAP